MRQKTLKNKKNLDLGQYVYIVIFAALFLFYYFKSDGLTVSGITNILRHGALTGIIAYGMALIIITGDIDLSVGAIMCCVASFGCLFANFLMLSGVPPFWGVTLTILFCLLGGTLLGFLNGILVGKVKLPAFIVTLATSLIFRSVTQYVSSNDVTSRLFRGEGSNNFAIIKNTTLAKELGNEMLKDADNVYEITNAFGKFQLFPEKLKLPSLGLVLILIGVILIFITTSTKYGKRLYAVGSNAKAAHMAGINVEWTRVSAFTITGLLCGVAAFLYLCDNGRAEPASVGKNYEMYAIASVVLGGISMTGGKGKLLGVIFGALSYGIIDKIIQILGLDTLIRDAVKGMILLIAIVIQIVTPQIKNLIAAKKAK